MVQSRNHHEYGEQRDAHIAGQEQHAHHLGSAFVENNQMAVNQLISQHHIQNLQENNQLQIADETAMAVTGSFPAM